MDEAQIRVEWRKQGQPSAEKLRLALRQKAAQGGPAAPTLAEVREAIRTDSTRQVVARKNIGAQGAITARAPDEIWQTDLISMEPLSEVKANTSNFILVAVDVFTRKLRATPVATKDPEVIVEGLKRIGVRGGVPKGALDVDRVVGGHRDAVGEDRTQRKRLKG